MVFKWFTRTGCERPFHIDYKQILYGDVDELKMAVQTQYTDEKRPLDVLIYAGLSELMRGAKARTVLESLMKFRDWIKNQNPDNSVVIATVPQAPTGSNDIVAEEFVTQTKRLNDGINRLNEEMSSPYPSRAPRFHMWGTRRTSSEDGQPTISKANVDDLNLKVQHQQRMGKALLGYFKGIYGLLPQDRTRCVLLTHEEARKRRNRKTAERKRRRNLLRRGMMNEQ